VAACNRRAERVVAEREGRPHPFLATISISTDAASSASSPGRNGV